MLDAESAKQKLASIKQRLQSGDVTETIKEFETFVFETHNHPGCGLPDALPQEDIKFFQKIFCEYETNLEKQKALDLINHECSEMECLEQDRVLARTYEYAQEEGRMAGVTETSRVLIIGSGPFPETAIAYAKIFKCSVTCVEKERKYVEISKRLLEKLNLSDKITVVEADGRTFDAAGFNKIMIAVLASPKEEILKNLRGSNADIIVRTAFGSSMLVYEGVDVARLDGFHIHDVLVRRGRNFTSSLLVHAKKH